MGSKTKGQGSADQGNYQLESPSDRFGARLTGRSSAAQLQARIVKQERETISQFFDSVESDDSVARAAALIVAARRRYVTGAGRSAMFARLLGYDLSLGLAQVSYVADEYSRMIEILTDVRATDVLIAFSMRRYRAETTHFLEKYAERGGQIVVITDFDDSPLVQFAHESIVVSTQSESFSDSGIAMVAVSQLLAALTTASAKGARRRLAERDELSTELNIYK